MMYYIRNNRVLYNTFLDIIRVFILIISRGGTRTFSWERAKLKILEGSGVHICFFFFFLGPPYGLGCCPPKPRGGSAHYVIT
jgi:hypothetical protein